MALNKSVKNTPGSRSGYLPEMTASTGKQTNFLLPVRIKVTPTNSCPLSDGKKNSSRMFQPVLIKDLLSSHKDKDNSTVTSASTQKKKTRAQRSTQPYLNTQSCYKPKKEVEESFTLSRKSFGGSKVRRQLYQTLDSPQKFGLESKEPSSKTVKPKKKNTQINEESRSISTQVQNKNRQSLLLPPNSIKNSFISKTETNFKALTRQTRKSTTSNVNRQVKSTLRITDARKSKIISRKSVLTKTEDDEDIESDYSTSGSGARQQSLYNKRDNFTMTSPTLNRDACLSKSTSDLSKLERPSVIMSPSTKKSASKYLNYSELPYLQMQSLNISKASPKSSEKDPIYTNNSKIPEFDFSGINRLDFNNLTQFKSFLEQSIKACETQVSNLKQVLNFVNTMLNNNTSTLCAKSNESPEADETLNVANKFVIYHDESDATDIIEKSIEMNNLTFEADALAREDNNVKANEAEKMIVQDRLPLPIKVLVSDVDLKQEAKELSSDLSEMARLSTIGEVSCEADESNKYELENKENQNNSQIITPGTPKTPKVLRRRLSCDSSNRRRSARLAAKHMSISESDNHDSFTMLENELNVERPITITSSKSLPASPMKPPTTPGVIRQWDKNIERPLKEYMALKMNGSFLVTPDVKRFQSCLELEPTDTPHSRKSLSRKIFMELCDLYAESPESK